MESRREPDRRLARRRLGRRTALAASTAWCVAVSACYWLQPDWLAPITLVPAWGWLFPGLTLVVCGLSRTRRRWWLAVGVLWLVYLLLMVEEIHSLTRVGSRAATARWTAARERGRALRVVSLNCAVGNPQAALEVTRWKPDVVLLQESPTGDRLEQVARELFGAEGRFVGGADTSIVARGEIHPRGVPRGSRFTHAEVELPSGLRAEVLSVRLSPPVFRLDFWMPGFWIDHYDKRIIHRREIAAVMRRLDAIGRSVPLIVGGDFNAPPDDAALVPLRRRLRDSFRQTGRGSGNTGTNGLPLFRVDQIWVSPDLHIETVRARKTLHSDHRMVVCDLTVDARKLWLVGCP